SSILNGTPGGLSRKVVCAQHRPDALRPREVAAQSIDQRRGTALADGLYRRFLMKANVGSTMIAAGALAAITMLATPSLAQNQPVQITPAPTPTPYPTTPYNNR